MKQHEHHAAKNFREEYMDMLNKFKIAYEDAYLGTTNKFVETDITKENKYPLYIYPKTL